MVNSKVKEKEKEVAKKIIENIEKLPGDKINPCTYWVSMHLFLWTQSPIVQQLMDTYSSVERPTN